jgi:hypothetical protein
MKLVLVLALLSCALAAPALSAALLVQPEAVSTAANDYNFSTSADERTAVFARSAADFAQSKIYITERGRRGWKEPRLAPFSDSRWRDSDPWLTPDGGTLYFVSDRPTAARPDKKDLDIWRSVKRKGRWSPPEHLGDVVNGRGEELGPELHAGVLYFATARKSGHGGLDIYRAAQTGRGQFASPELMPAPINSAASESDFTLSRDGATAIFWQMVGERGLLHRSRLTPAGWSEPEVLPDTINLGPFNFTPALSPDGSRLTFASTRPRAGQPAGLADVYETSLGSGR